MRSTRTEFPLWMVAGFLGAVFALPSLGCRDALPEVSVTAVQLGKGGGGPDKGPKVTAADPPNSPPGLQLDVRVLGSGFDEGSQATFLLDELPTEHIVTTAPATFVSQSELVAHIEILSTAALDLYDIQVRTSRGKGGIGIELFAVDLSWAVFDDGTGLRILGDGAGGDVDNDGDTDPNGYSDAEPCVRVSDAQVRTVANTELCKAAATYRVLHIDQAGLDHRFDFDQDGTTEDVEAPPARFFTSENKGKLGCDGSGSHCVTLLIMQVFDSGPATTGQETIWRVRYRASVSPTGAVPLIELLGTDAVADVCHHTDEGAGNKGCNPGASVETELPFRVTWKGLN